MLIRIVTFAALIVCLHTCLCSEPDTSISNPGIDATGRSRPFVYTNTQTAFYYGETGGPNTTSWQGFNVLGKEFLDDYELLLNDTPLRREDALRVVVYPDHLERMYRDHTVEEVWPVDSLPMLAIMLRSPKPVTAALLPSFTDGRSRSGYKIRLREGLALVARSNHPSRTPSANYPAWLAVGCSGALPETTSSSRGRSFSPVRLHAPPSRTHLFAFAVGDTPDETERLVRAFLQNSGGYLSGRRTRIAGLLERSAVHTGDARFDRAMLWAVASLDALIMDQSGKGIFAGLPWFNNYWGRDTFISLPGAVLVTGRFREAREILRSFSQFQERNPESPHFGKIPNIVTTTDTAYNTADGTPRFVMMLKEYVERSGDDSLLAELYPVLLRSIDGTLQYHVDDHGFLLHGDADTWMDAAGPDGPWSPRGNRANDIQALWAEQLEAGVWAATRIGDVRSARTWQAALLRLRESFPKYFIIDDHIADHLRPDGTPDLRVRPNQIFTSALLDPLVRARMLHTVVTGLTYPYGVASLAQTDEQFHPYHEFPPYYPKDAAYHNGTVWTWLQGPVISALCDYGLQDTAFVITSHSVFQILDRACVGTQSELLDALPRPGEVEPRTSGTVSQAWNLAEFIRNFYDDYLGARIERLSRRITIRPHLPRSLGNIRASLALDGQPALLTIRDFATRPVVTLDARALNHPYAMLVELPRNGISLVECRLSLPPHAVVTFSIGDTGATVAVNGKRAHASVTERPMPPLPDPLRHLRLATPQLKPGLKALAGPGYPLLTLAEISKRNDSAVRVAHAEDPEGDDTGAGSPGNGGSRYEYPANPDFLPGSFDIRECTVAVDSVFAYFTLRFRTLSDPGWHPEYGFQLTCAAIAIDADGINGSGSFEIPANAHYRLAGSRAFERLVLVGGGVRIEDSQGRILAAYLPVPEDGAGPFGDAASGTIRFALPRSLIGGAPGQWRFTVVAGAQDDHGGAGIGEFRTIDPIRGEWHGGGRLKPDEPNVYDDLLMP